MGRSRHAARQSAHQSLRRRLVRARIRRLPQAGARIRRAAEANPRRSEPRVSEKLIDEILPDHSDLLRQRRAAHRARLHHLRRRPIKRFKRMQGYDPVMSHHRHRRARPEGGARRARPPAEPAGVHRHDGRRVPAASGRSSASTTTISSAPPIPSITRPCAGCSSAASATATSTRAPTPASIASSTKLYVNDAKPGDPCPDCGRPTETVTEENYFFKLSAFQEQLLELYEKHPEFIQPDTAATK